MYVILQLFWLLFVCLVGFYFLRFCWAGTKLFLRLACTMIWGIDPAKVKRR
jgi:hypothetical protein